MAVTAGQFVNQTDMDALATLANTNLLPLVNAAIATGNGWPVHAYTFNPSAYPQAVQPNYGFTNQADVLIFSPSVSANYDSSGNYVLTVPVGYNFIKWISGQNDYYVHVPTSISQNYNSYFTQKAIATNGASSVTLIGSPGSPVTASVYQTWQYWTHELNRIRADFYNLVFGVFINPPSNPINSGLYLNSDTLVSGPWIVGVNDSTTFPLPNCLPIFGSGSGNPGLSFTTQGELFPVFNNMSVMESVQFICGQADAIGLSVGTGIKVIGKGGTTAIGTGHQKIILTATPSIGGTWQAKITFWLCWNTGGTAPIAPPPTSGFTFVLTGLTSATWATILGPKVVNSDASTYQTYYLTATVNTALGSGATAMTFDVTLPANYEFISEYGSSTDYKPAGTSFVLAETHMIYATTSATSPVNGLHPTQPLVSLSPSAPVLSTTYTLSVGTNGGSFDYPTAEGPCYVTFPYVNGVWAATTYPVPANNVFVDQDMPPFVGQYAESFGGRSVQVAVASNPPVGTPPDNTNASSMRETGTFANGTIPLVIGGFTVGTTPNYTYIEPSITPRPAKYQVLRNSSFVPFTYGFNLGDQIYTTPQQSTPSLSVSYFQFPFYNSDVAGLKIRLVQSNTAQKGWQNGILIYGQTLTPQLQIYCSITNYPTLTNTSLPYDPVSNPMNPATYDFSTSNNDVDIPPNGTSTYLSSGQFFFTILNPNLGTVNYDLVQEVDLVNYPVRQYFPPLHECFSYCLNGAAPANTGLSNCLLKLIPQSGYCIFKIRATRTPQDNGNGIQIIPSVGNLITVTIGTNRLAGGSLVFTPFLLADGITPYTVTIPTNARDSGDVGVFWPVLGGTELVWQCSENVMVEAWVNWQPIFFSGTYGFGELIEGIPGTLVATCFQYCLAFANDLDTFQSGYSASSPSAITNVQFPISKDVYNDTEAVLNLI